MTTGDSALPEVRRARISTRDYVARLYRRDGLARLVEDALDDFKSFVGRGLVGLGGPARSGRAVVEPP